jgi:hypothetical protein
MSEANLDYKMTETDKLIEAAVANKAKRAIDPDREAKKAALAVERNQRALEREAKKLEREEARANRPVHMAKVERAAALLPQLSDRGQALFGEITASLSRDNVAALAAHLNHFNRVNATQASAATTLSEGMQVRIIGGDPKHVGRVGTIERSQRIRCYVNIGESKPVYLYSADVERVEAAVAEAV